MPKVQLNPHGAELEDVAPCASDQELLPRLRTGDEAAAREFYLHYAERIYRFICQILGSLAHAEAEDLLQETFIALAEALPFFRGQSSLFTFACAIAHRKALSFIRKHAHRHPANPTRAGDPGQFVGDDSEAAEMRSALALLSADHREVLFLKYVEEFRVGEIAAILSLTEHAVESRLARARRALKKALEDLR